MGRRANATQKAAAAGELPRLSASVGLWHWCVAHMSYTVLITVCHGAFCWCTKADCRCNCKLRLRAYQSESHSQSQSQSQSHTFACGRIATEGYATMIARSFAVFASNTGGAWGGAGVACTLWLRGTGAWLHAHGAGCGSARRMGPHATAWVHSSAQLAHHQGPAAAPGCLQRRCYPLGKPAAGPRR